MDASNLDSSIDKSAQAFEAGAYRLSATLVGEIDPPKAPAPPTDGRARWTDGLRPAFPLIRVP